MKHFFCILFVSLVSITLIPAQENRYSGATETTHNSEKGIRIGALIGHTYINSDGADNNLYIPSIGLDIDYWFNHNWGVGLHNDIEIDNFVVVRGANEKIEREYPIVLTIDALYHLGSGFVVSLGPGIEVERNESFALVRLGLEYEKFIDHRFYIMPTIFYDQRFDGFSTATIGLGVGHKF